MAIELTVEYKRLNAFFADYTKNIGRGGTFIATAKPLPIGTEFTFRLVIPTLEEPLRLRGKVQWIVSAEEATDEQPAGMGIGFVYTSEAERERIAGAVEQLMTAQLGRPLFDKLMSHRRRVE
jgi:type IV pilus assembly protein PilZ